MSARLSRNGASAKNPCFLTVSRGSCLGDYVKSVRDFWRVCSGINEESRKRVVKFLSEVLNVEKFPLTVLDRPLESETCKIVENSYRATILAFLDEWSAFAETNGVDLIKVINAIKVRPTHSNMIFPGPGIGVTASKGWGLGIGPTSICSFRQRHFQDHALSHRYQRYELSGQPRLQGMP
jgi:UDP-glucose 6-dehydrogenase